MPLFGAAYAAPDRGTTILYWFRSPKTQLNPPVNGIIQGLFKAFECFSSTFQGKFNFQWLLKTVLYIQVFFKPVRTLITIGLSNIVRNPFFVYTVNLNTYTFSNLINHIHPHSIPIRQNQILIEKGVNMVVIYLHQDICSGIQLENAWNQIPKNNFLILSNHLAFLVEQIVTG